MEKSTPSLFETLQKGTDQDIMGARDDIELAQNLLSSTTVYQIDGWTPSKKEGIRDKLSSLLRLSTTRQFVRVSSRIGKKFPISKRLPHTPQRLLEILRDSTFIAKGGGGVVFRSTIGRKQQIYKIVILNESFLTIKQDWDSVFNNEIIPAYHASNLYGPKIDWHCIYYNIKHERIDKAIGVIAMESFDGDLYSLIKKTPLKHRYDILTTCFHRIKGLLDNQLASTFTHTHYFCHDIRDANILYRKNQIGGVKTKTTTKTKTKRGLTGAKSRKSHTIKQKATRTKSTQLAPTQPQYTFILSDFDHSHCNLVSETEYSRHRDALHILLYCRISLHFSELMLQEPRLDFIDYLRGDRQGRIIGYAVIEALFQHKSRELDTFFRSQLWTRIALDFHFYTPYHIEGWGLEEPNHISSLLKTLYQPSIDPTQSLPPPLPPPTQGKLI